MGGKSKEKHIQKPYFYNDGVHSLANTHYFVENTHTCTQQIIPRGKLEDCYILVKILKEKIALSSWCT